MNRLTRHALAFLRTAFALVGAALAMFHVMLAAFLATGAANFSANAADIGCEFRAGGHEHRCRATHGGTVAIQRDAPRHHLHVLFAQALGSAMRAFVRAVVTGFNAINEFFVRHTDLLQNVRNLGPARENATRNFLERWPGAALTSSLHGGLRKASPRWKRRPKFEPRPANLEIAQVEDYFCCASSFSIILRSLLSAMFWIWRTRSRVTPNFWPTSSSVFSDPPSRPKR